MSLDSNNYKSFALNFYLFIYLFLYGNLQQNLLLLQEFNIQLLIYRSYFTEFFLEKYLFPFF